MWETFYPKSLEQLFTNRERELAILSSVKENLLSSNPRHIALLGHRRMGKTTVLKRFIREIFEDEDVVPVYVNFEEICTSPEIFTQRYIGSICSWFLTKGKEDITPFLSIYSLPRTGALRIPAVVETVTSIQDQLSRSKVDQALLLRTAFDFPTKLALDSDRKLILFLDEFQYIEALSNYPQIKDALRFFRGGLEGQTNVAYVLAGSAISLMERIIRSESSPVFLQFEIVRCGPFTRQSTIQLVRKLVDGVSRSLGAEIYRHTFGHPFYIVAICRRVADMEQITPDGIGEAFVLETLSPDGAIYNYCRYMYDISLERATGQGLLKAILHILAEEEGLTLSEIARGVERSAPATKEYLRWLREVDLIREEEKRYYFHDQVLRYWIAHIAKGVEIDAQVSSEVMSDLVRTLEERFLEASRELGLARESQVRELLRSFDGREIPGGPFGCEGDIHLPRFLSVEPYLSEGREQFDALAVGDEIWAVEVKWRSREAGKKELEDFYSKTHMLADRLWFISRMGFRTSARGFASQRKILISDADDVRRIAEELGMRFAR